VVLLLYQCLVPFSRSNHSLNVDAGLEPFSRSNH
jgi:hypothetical protein